MTEQRNEPQIIVVEKSSTGTILLAILLLAALVGGLILFNRYDANETAKSNAIDKTADQIGQAIDKADHAVDDAAKAAKKHI